MGPIVNQKKADSLATNIDRYNAASAAIEASKTAADSKYDEQETLLADVKTQVEAGLNKAELLQSLTTAVKKIVKTRLYDFTAGSADDFEDKAAGDYHNDFDATTYNGDTDTLTGMINSLIAQNNNQLAVVETTSDADLATEVSRRDTRISAADARLQADVNFANGELVAAQAAQDAQEIIKDAAIADRVLKESIFYQTLEEGNNRKAAALAKRVTCVTNAEAAYTAETASYAASLSSQNELLDYELSVVGQMRAAMNGEEFGASPEMKTFDHCTDEKATADAAAAECNNDKNDCEHSKITALNDGSTKTARRLLGDGHQHDQSSPCDEEAAACAAKASTRAAYESCLGPASLLSTEELKAAFVQLHSKYASETDMSDTFSEHQDEMESILQAVEAKISGEREAAQTQHDADVASSLAKKNSDVADCNAAEQAVIDKWDAK